MTSSLLSLSLRDADLPLLREALEDAVAWRAGASPLECWRCHHMGNRQMCPDHAGDDAQADLYRELLERIGDET